MKINEFIKYEECAWNWSLSFLITDTEVETIKLIRNLYNLLLFPGSPTFP